MFFLQLHILIVPRALGALLLLSQQLLWFHVILLMLTTVVHLYFAFLLGLCGKVNALFSSLWILQFFGLNPQLSDERIRAGCPHQHLFCKSPATFRRVDSCKVPSSAPFSLVNHNYFPLETGIFCFSEN